MTAFCDHLDRRFNFRGSQLSHAKPTKTVKIVGVIIKKPYDLSHQPDTWFQ